jgi:hypothetical protein
MKTKLLLAAALLAPTLAFSANPSADLSVQVVPVAPAVGIACAFGPNFTGTVPAPAQAAGYNTCVANLDFTATSSFVNSGHTYQWSNLSSWLSCPRVGASTAILYLVGDSGTPNPQCSDISVATDGGVQVLKMDLPQSNPNGTGGDALISVAGDSGTPGWTISLGAYYQATIREPSCSSQPTNFHCSNFWMWVINQSGASHIEVDHEEDYTGGAGSFTHIWGGAGSGGGSSSPTFPLAQWPPTSSYATVGSLVTHDGSSTYADCNYSNGVAVSASCQSASTDAAHLSTRNYTVMSGSAGANSIVLNQDQIVYWKKVLIFACASWQTTNCPGSVITTAP